MARQIGKMLHAREPKIINGPGMVNLGSEVTPLIKILILKTNGILQLAMVEDIDAV